MPLIISHSSALERLRSVPPRFDSAEPLDVPFELDWPLPDCRRLTRIDFRSYGISQQPVHLLVPGPVNQNRSRKAVLHTRTPSVLPPGSLRMLGADLYVAGPELCFMQVASQVSPLGGIVLGFELCGTYSHFAPLVSGFYERPPLTSAKRIGEYLDASKGCRGSGAARRVLGSVLDGAASPMETVLACMLTLPNDFGGEGFCRPELNLEVPLEAAEKSMTGTDSCRIDVAWSEQRIGLEYNGAPYHTDAAADRRRLEALAHAGWTIYVVDIGRIASPGEYAKLLGLLEGSVPRRRGMARADGVLSKDLLRRLMRLTRCNLGLEAVLLAPGVPRGAVRMHVG